MNESLKDGKKKVRKRKIEGAEMQLRNIAAMPTVSTTVKELGYPIFHFVM
jgi:hypothetical protein